MSSVISSSWNILTKIPYLAILEINIVLYVDESEIYVHIF